MIDDSANDDLTIQRNDDCGFRLDGLNRGPEEPAAHFRIYLALLPSGPDAVRRLKLHRFRTAVQSARVIVLYFFDSAGTIVSTRSSTPRTTVNGARAPMRSSVKRR